MATERECLTALSIHAERLSKLPNVHGLGVGERVVGDALTAEYAVRVYVSRKVPPSQLAGGEMIPDTLELVLSGEDSKYVPVDVIEENALELE